MKDTALPIPIPVLSQAWAIHEPVLLQLLDAARSGDYRAAAPARPAPAALGSRAQGVAVIPIRGVIEQEQSLFGFLTGGTSIARIRAAVADALAAPKVSAIVLDINSPGGATYGLTELAAEIRRARSAKPITAVATGLMASAAYWIGSQATRVIASPSSEVGSVGVYAAHLDLSGNLSQRGVKVSLVSAGKGKLNGNPYEALSDPARAELQRGVYFHYQAFLADVSDGRAVPESRIANDWKALMYQAPDALRLGLVDGIAPLDQAIATASQVGPLASAARAGRDHPGLERDLAILRAQNPWMEDRARARAEARRRGLLEVEYAAARLGMGK